MAKNSTRLANLYHFFFCCHAVALLLIRKWCFLCWIHHEACLNWDVACGAKFTHCMKSDEFGTVSTWALVSGVRFSRSNETDFCFFAQYPERYKIFDRTSIASLKPGLASDSQEFVSMPAITNVFNTRGPSFPTGRMVERNGRNTTLNINNSAITTNLGAR